MIFDAAKIDEIVRQAIEADLHTQGRRDFLFFGVAREYVAGLPARTEPDLQLRSDLERMSRDGRVGGKIPLAIWLRRAANQTSMFLDRSNFFTSCAEEAEAWSAPSVVRSGWPRDQPSFKLASLIDGEDVTFVPISLHEPGYDAFYISSGRLSAREPQAQGATEFSRIALIDLLKRLHVNWPRLRPPAYAEAQAAFFANEGPARLKRPNGGCLWCVEQNRLVARRYSGEAIDSDTADLWLVYPS